MFIQKKEIHCKSSKIISSTIELVADKGFHGVSVSDIAARSGVAAGTIYCYFENKEVLLKEAFKSIETKLMHELVSSCPKDKDFITRYKAVYTKILKFFIENKNEFKYLEQFMNSPYGLEQKIYKFSESKNSRSYLIRELVEEVIKIGEIKPLAVSVLYSIDIGIIENVVKDHNSDILKLDEALIEEVINACLDATRLKI